MTNDDLEALRTRLVAGAAIAQRLSAATDALTATLRSIEEEIAAYRLNVRAEVPLEDGRLAFEEHAGVWRLVHYADPSLRDGVPLVNASRAVRLKAVDAIDPLFRELLAAATARTHAVLRANEDAVAILSLIKSLGTPGGKDE